VTYVDLELEISRDTLMLYYQGVTANVVTPALDGRSVSFPARILRDFVNHSGVSGRFRLYHDESGRFIRMERLR
jgi:hypothetical protein